MSVGPIIHKFKGVSSARSCEALNSDHIQGDKPKEKTNKMEVLTCLKSLTAHMKSEDDMLTVSEKSAYANGMRNNLKALRKKIMGQHTKLLDAANAMNDEQLAADIDNIKKIMTEVTEYISDRAP